jgi:hypothetical protein
MIKLQNVTKVPFISAKVEVIFYFTDARSLKIKITPNRQWFGRTCTGVSASGLQSLRCLTA